MIVLGLSTCIDYLFVISLVYNNDCSWSITSIDYLFVISLSITMIVHGLSLVLITYWLLVCI